MKTAEKVAPFVWRVSKNILEKDSAQVFDELSQSLMCDYSWVHIRDKKEIKDKAINGNAKHLHGVPLDFRGANYLIVKPNPNMWMHLMVNARAMFSGPMPKHLVKYFHQEAKKIYETT